MVSSVAVDTASQDSGRLYAAQVSLIEKSEAAGPRRWLILSGRPVQARPQAQRMVEQHDIMQLNPVNMLQTVMSHRSRSAARPDSRRGGWCDDVVVGMVADRIEKLHAVDRFILDSFPARGSVAERWTKYSPKRPQAGLGDETEVDEDSPVAHQKARRRDAGGPHTMTMRGADQRLAVVVAGPRR